MFSRERLIAVRASIRAMDKLDIATGVRNQKKEEAQGLAGALLDAEVRLGELFGGMEVKSLNNLKQNRGSIGGTSGKTKFKTIEALGFDDPKKTAYRFEALAANLDSYQEVAVTSR